MNEPRAKELSEAIAGALELGLLLTEHLKDGFQVEDLSAVFSALFTEGPVKEKVTAAFDGYSKISAETKELAVEDYMAIVAIFLGYLPRFVAALKPVAKDA